MKYYIDGCEIKSVMRVPMRSDGSYVVRFPHDAVLSQLESINWDKPTIVLNEPRDTNKTYLPTGCGFVLDHLTYSSHPMEWKAEIKVGKQYLGDVTGYQAQIDKLTAQSADQQSTISNQKQEIAKLEVQLAEADELAIALYEAQMAAEESQEVTEE
ncbi:MAG: hypothetical protein MR004_10455 [Clostridiales bacterium]|nr:hypothetical protein [Clostridiales bacterium]MDY4037662.1 hypothetical protein [Candidatus Pseudoscilispira sp.]